LKQANTAENRKQRPWLVAFGHRPLYCSVENYPDCQNGVALQLEREIEPLFVQNGVDIAVFGHIHSMERSYPVSYDATVCGDYSNPCGTVHIVNGAEDNLSWALLILCPNGVLFEVIRMVTQE